jgi:hypothetical protein
MKKSCFKNILEKKNLDLIFEKMIEIVKPVQTWPTINLESMDNNLSEHKRHTMDANIYVEYNEGLFPIRLYLNYNQHNGDH